MAVTERSLFYPRSLRPSGRGTYIIMLDEEEKRWVLCPYCGAKTRLQLLRETELKALPLFCPKCRQESVINAKNFIIETGDARR